MNDWRRLPIPLAPARHETLTSWLRRLAAVHGLPSSTLDQHVGIQRRVRHVDAAAAALRRLAAITGYQPVGLAWALPELRLPPADWRSLRHLAQRACPRCTARHEGGQVRQLFAHDEYLCTRHGYWIGPPDGIHDDPPLSLAARLPELVAAQHRLRRATRRHGWAATFDATVSATRICLDLRFSAPHHPLWRRWEQRLHLLMPGGYRRSLFMAAIFPEVTALAAVIASPTGRAVTAQQRPVEFRPFLDACAHALDCRGTADAITDATMTWANARAARSRMEPAAIYPDTIHHHDGSPRVTEKQVLAEERIAHRFARDRRAPRTFSPVAPLPYAHRPAPAATGRSN
ncbi:TniQ family protein [Plantactinospora sp. WMMB334]|uniref:TniQ family protein n=1 Tax=Plantactinospora sp. WMMB334 TaxID=3404119 RepID=UPI003B9228D3